MELDTAEYTWTPGKIILENHGELVMPVVLQVTFEGGEQRTIKLPVDIWSTTNRWTEPLTGNEQITAVVLDPDGDFPDADRSNNSWKPRR